MACHPSCLPSPPTEGGLEGHSAPGEVSKTEGTINEPYEVRRHHSELMGCPIHII